MKKVLLVCGLLTSLVVGPVSNAEEQTFDSTNGVTTTVEESSVVEDSSLVEESSMQEEEVPSEVPDLTDDQGQILDKESFMEQLPGGPRNGIATRSGGTVAIYRLYNPNSGAHHYTKLTSERDNLKRAGWKYEGIAWYAHKSGANVYRLYNPNSGEHFFTTSSSEKDFLRNSGWNYEGIAFYASTKSKSPTFTAVYRLFNPNTNGPGSHHYTTSASEAYNLVTVGWRLEKVAFYV